MPPPPFWGKKPNTKRKKFEVKREEIEEKEHTSLHYNHYFARKALYVLYIVQS